MTHSLGIRSQLQQRLWKSGVALGLFVITLLIGNIVLLNRSATRIVGLDFIAFYTAGTFVREGRVDQLYDLKAVASYQKELATAEGSQLEGGFGPWWNPPFYALIFEPLSRLPFASAVRVWLGINIACVFVSVALLCRMFAKNSSWRIWGLVPLLTLISMPFLLMVTHGQNTGTSLLLLTGVVTAWRSNRPLLAGLVCGLLFYKPQLAAIVACVLVASAGPYALAGVGITLVTLACVTLAVMPGAIGDYLHRLPENLHAMMIGHTYMWERHVTLRSFWRLLIQGRGPGEATLLTHALTLSTCAAAAVAMGACCIRFRMREAFRNSSVSRDRLIAAAIACMPLLMPFYFDYDLLLLAIPLVLVAREKCSAQDVGQSTADQWLVRGVIALYLWLLVANHVTPLTHFNFTVPLLSGIAALLIRRAWQPLPMMAQEASICSSPVALRTAA